MVKVINKISGIVVGIIFLKWVLYRNFINDKGDKIYFILWPSSINEFVTYFLRGFFLQDLVLANSLTLEGYSFKVIAGKRIDTVPRNSKVVYSMTLFTPEYQNCKRVSQGESLFRYLQGINSVEFYPKVDEARMWENKEYMHGTFEKLNIPCPNTKIVKDFDAFNDILDIDFPVLTKASNSNQSKGIDLHHNAESLMNAINKKLLKYSSVLIQDVVNVNYDIRVVVIGGNVVYHYWRHKPHVEDGRFITTSTNNGGTLDIKRLPKVIEKACIEASYKLNLSLAAYDVTLYKGEVVFFEVSPSFILNPIPKILSVLKAPYTEYKKKYLRYNVDLINQFTEIKRLQVRTWNL